MRGTLNKGDVFLKSKRDFKRGGSIRFRGDANFADEIEKSLRSHLGKEQGLDWKLSLEARVQTHIGEIRWQLDKVKRLAGRVDLHV